jgi:hypothetical protein
MIGKMLVFIAVIQGTAATAIQFYMEIQTEWVLMCVALNMFDSRCV